MDRLYTLSLQNLGPLDTVYSYTGYTLRSHDYRLCRVDHVTSWMAHKTWGVWMPCTPLDWCLSYLNSEMCFHNNYTNVTINTEVAVSRCRLLYVDQWVW